MSQTPLAQSPFTAHIKPSAQSAQLPPQSMSVSLPFIVLSLQVGAGATHVPLVQTPLVQSVPVEQVEPLVTRKRICQACKMRGYQ